VDVIIPVKSSHAKSRLSSVLSESERRKLSKNLLSDLLAVLTATGVLAHTHVISSDAEMLAFASRHGARAIAEDGDAGVNVAVRRALRQIGIRGDVLVLPSDLALLRPSELGRFCGLRRLGLDVVMSPSKRFNGTNALLFSSASRFPLSYDDDSFWNHLASCGRLGLSVGICCERGLMFDLDTPQDLEVLAKSRSSSRSAGFARRNAN
jgi:2-phospho-L-lactate guanylyltransferase